MWWKFTGKMGEPFSWDEYKTFFSKKLSQLASRTTESVVPFLLNSVTTTYRWGSARRESPHPWYCLPPWHTSPTTHRQETQITRAGSSQLSRSSKERVSESPGQFDKVQRRPAFFNLSFFGCSRSFLILTFPVHNEAFEANDDDIRPAGNPNRRDFERIRTGSAPLNWPFF